MLYINKKGTNDWCITSGLQLPMEATESSVPFDKSTVLNETDLVKLKNENPEYYQKKINMQGHIIGRRMLSICLRNLPGMKRIF